MSTRTLRQGGTSRTRPNTRVGRHHVLLFLVFLLLLPYREAGTSHAAERKAPRVAGPVVLPPGARAAAAAALRQGFASNLAQATGPNALAELHSRCKKEKLAEEAARIEQILRELKPAAGLPSGYRERVARRARCAEARRALDQFLVEGADKTGDRVRDLLQWMKKESFAPDALRAEIQAFAAAVGEATSSDATGLAADTDALPHTVRGPEAEKRLEAAARARLKTLRTQLASSLLRAADTCVSAGETGLAFDLLQKVLEIDPDERRARSGLGQVRVGERWMRTHAAERCRAGWVWDSERAWILASEMSRYEKGDYLDPAEKRWAPLEDWNRIHSDPSTPWRIPSEHFELVSTADLATSARVLERLEAFFLRAFRELDGFFAHRGAGQQTKLVLGVAPMSKPLRVHVYRNREQFLAHAKPSATWAAGFYSREKGASYFYCSGTTVPVSVLQHELTHQILGQLSGGQAPAWITEGIAVYLEDLVLDEGELQSRQIDRMERVSSYRERVRQGGRELELAAVIGLQTQEDWDSGDVSGKYRGAGAAVSFLMNLDGGLYRGDFLDMLRDSYLGNVRSVESYFGLSMASLCFLMDRFYRECSPPLVAGCGESLTDA